MGDASLRRYESLHDGTSIALLMDMPERSDKRIVRHGKSYSALVHLADDIRPVIAVNSYLHGLGYSAPRIEVCDQHQGFAVIEHLQGEVHGTMMVRGDDMTEPMSAAVAVLADMARQAWPRKVPAHGGFEHLIADFDIDALLAETDLLPSWFWPHLHGREAPPDAHQSFEDVWRAVLPLTFTADRMWVLRDFHSPNLIWMPQREGLQRTGLIDTQDAVMGNATYDLASLLQDARVDVDFSMQHALYDHYVTLRQAGGSFDAVGFGRDYAILGAQRASRLLGTFTRLSKRDGKHQYLQHRPRVARYLVHNLQHVALKPVLHWYEHNLPEVLALARP